MNELIILLLEDDSSGAELLDGNPRDGGLAFTILHVDTELAFKQALSNFNPDIVRTGMMRA